jgi:flavodoxin
MENLVVYFSFSGNSKKIAKGFPGDHLEIELNEDLPKFKPLRMFKIISLTRKNHVFKLNFERKNFDKYDEITFIYPVWMGSPAKPMVDFINGQKFKNKSIILIQSYNSKPKKAMDEMKSILTGNNVRHTLNYKKTQIQM